MLPNISSPCLHTFIAKLSSAQDISQKTHFFVEHYVRLATHNPTACNHLAEEHKGLLEEVAAHLTAEQIEIILVQSYSESPKVNGLLAELLATLKVCPLLLANIWRKCDVLMQHAIINHFFSRQRRELLQHIAIMLRAPIHMHSYLRSESTPEPCRIVLVNMLRHKEARLFRKMYRDVQDVGLLITILHKMEATNTSLKFLIFLKNIFKEHEKNSSVYPELAPLLAQIKELQNEYQCDFFDLFCFQLMLWIKKAPIEEAAISATEQQSPAPANTEATPAAEHSAAILYSRSKPCLSTKALSSQIGL